MIHKSCKRLAEMDFPIAAVSAHSAAKTSSNGRWSECRSFPHEQPEESNCRPAARTLRELW